MANFKYINGGRCIVLSAQEVYETKMNIRNNMGWSWWLHPFLYKRIVRVALKRKAEDFFRHAKGGVNA